MPVPAWAADEADPFDGSMPEEVGLLGPRRPRAVENMAFSYNEKYKTMENHTVEIVDFPIHSMVNLSIVM